MDSDRLTYLLQTWAEWSRRDDHGLGYPSTAAGIRWRPGDDFDGMVASLDETMALAVDACVDGLPDNERIAVGVVVLASPRVWRFREPIEVIYARAREMLKVRLNARGIE